MRHISFVPITTTYYSPQAQQSQYLYQSSQAQENGDDDNTDEGCFLDIHLGKYGHRY